LHQEFGIGCGNREERAVAKKKAFGNQAMQVWMKTPEIVAVGLDGGNHARKGGRCGVGFPEELLEYLVKALAQQSKELAVVLEKDAEHFGNRNDILSDRDFFEDLLLDPLGKENHSLLMARGAEISAFTRKCEQKLTPALPAAKAGETMANVSAIKELLDNGKDNRSPKAVLA